MIIIEPQIIKKMREDASQNYPFECCGFLFGYEKREERAITDILTVLNNKEGDKRRRFEISPKDYIKAEQYAEDNGLTLLGIYHSHPNHPAIPSEEDRKSAQPFFSYVILSIADGQRITQRSWRLTDLGFFHEEKLIIPQQSSNLNLV